MMSTVEKVSTLHLFSAAIIISCIERIQKTCPGWWWSISQYLSDDGKQEIMFTMGPGRNGPHAPDKEYALTKEGDNGSQHTYTYLAEVEDLTIFQEIGVLSFLDKLITSFDEIRQIDSSKADFTPAPDDVLPYRRQSNNDLELLRQHYNKVISLPELLKEKDYTLKEVYLGSCDFSADCSLRGYRPDQSEFDISVDLTEDATIAESVAWALQEMSNEVSTPKSC